MRQCRVKSARWHQCVGRGGKHVWKEKAKIIRAIEALQGTLGIHVCRGVMATIQQLV